MPQTQLQSSSHQQALTPAPYQFPSVLAPGTNFALWQDIQPGPMGLSAESALNVEFKTAISLLL